MNKTIELETSRFEADIIQTLLLAIFTTSAVFYHALAQLDVQYIGFAGSGPILGFYTTAENWFYFTTGVSISIWVIALIKTAKYIDIEQDFEP